jgi:hypothetical protein
LKAVDSNAADAKGIIENRFKILLCTISLAIGSVAIIEWFFLLKHELSF